jgi:hypothetical protein
MQILIREFRQLIKNVLIEKRQKHSEDRYEDAVTTLKQYVDKNLFFHMTYDYNLQGLNINTEYNTPIGIYTYPLTKEFFENIMSNNLPFAGNRKYIIIYKPRRDPLKVSKYTWFNFYEDAKKLGYDVDKIIDQEKVDKEGLPIRALFWCLYEGGKFGSFEGDNKEDDYEAYRGEFVKANKNLRKLGYSGIYDDVGAGVIHENEPIQAFFVGSNMLNIIDIVNNPTTIISSLMDKIVNVRGGFVVKNKKILNHLSNKQILTLLTQDPEFIKAIDDPTDEMIKHALSLEPKLF